MQPFKHFFSNKLWASPIYNIGNAHQECDVMDFIKSIFTYKHKSNPFNTQFKYPVRFKPIAFSNPNTA